MKKTLFILTLIFCNIAIAQTTSTKMYSITNGKEIGTVRFSDSNKGLVIKTHLKNLSPGFHGFHIHTNPTCANNGLAAGGHLDPLKTDKHLGPYKNGHLGDLPVLRATKNGVADDILVAPRLSVKAIRGHSVIIHQDGDNYSDHPKPLGGGGARIACGVIR